MVTGCCEGSCDAQLLVSPPRALASLPSPAGTGCAAGSSDACSHHDEANRLGSGTKKVVVCDGATRVCAETPGGGGGGCCCCSVTYERVCMSTPPQDELTNPLEPSSTHSCEHSKARKTGAQPRDNRRSAKNDAKCVEKAHHRHHKQQCRKSSPLLCCTTGMSTITGDN